MTDVLKVVKETANLKPKMWVRLKRGIFKDDLAQVWTAYSSLFHRIRHVRILGGISWTCTVEPG